MIEYEVNLQRIIKFAKDNNLILNPDKERVNHIVSLMTNNFKSIGEYICPCKQKHKPPKKGMDTLCPCTEIKEEISKKGHCHCQLFYSPKSL